jgi:hypothetical protein
MITLKKIIEGVDDIEDDIFNTMNSDEMSSGHVDELSGQMGRSPTTFDTPKAFSPVGAPVRTNEQQFSKKLTSDEKKKLLELVGKFAEYRKAMKMADELKNVAENIVYIAEMTEKYGMNETSDWFDGVSLERDMKEIKKYAEGLHKIANKVHPQIREAEYLYEEIGLKLEKFYSL